MSGFLITFISAVVLYVASMIIICYQKYCLGKRYELARHISEFLKGAAVVSFTYWFLERFFSGLATRFGWWALAFVFACTISIILRFATNSICKRAWFKGEDMEITTVKLPKGLKTARLILFVIICVGFVVFISINGVGLFFRNNL